MSRWHATLAAGTARRYAVLFFVLLASLVLGPVLRPLPYGSEAVETLIALSLLVAVGALYAREVRRPAIAILVALLLARLLAGLAGQQTVAAASLAAWGVAALGAAAGALRFALRGKAIGSEQVYAALSAYVLAGFCFALLFWALDHFAPGSLALGQGMQPGTAHIGAMVYFSFVTLASLGYGDILPLSDLARGMAVIEVIGGQLYLAALVARLVGALR